MLSSPAAATTRLEIIDLSCEGLPRIQECIEL